MKLEDLEKLCAEATPGPWASFYHNRTEAWAVTHAAEGMDAINDRGNVIATAIDGTSSHAANFEFIAASRTALPKLIAVAKAAKEVVTHSVDAQKRHGDIPIIFYAPVLDLKQALAELEKE